jgi:hypothetical protein
VIEGKLVFLNSTVDTGSFDQQVSFSSRFRSGEIFSGVFIFSAIGVEGNHSLCFIINLIPG